VRITVELVPGRDSEFAHYVPAQRQLPEVVLRPAADREYFPVGVKHRYTRAPRP
jgi:phenylacetate-CoA ligase